MKKKNQSKNDQLITDIQRSVKFNFSKQLKSDYLSITYNEKTGVPLYDSNIGYGFVQETCAFPPRPVHTKEITTSDYGFVITEPYFSHPVEKNSDDYNHFGMAFRINVPPGAYEIVVRTTSPVKETMIGISGMRPLTEEKERFWDASKLIQKNTTAETSEYDWRFQYVNGRDFIDVELEPKFPKVPVGLQEIVVTSIPPNNKKVDDLPTISLLGDSTVKSYTFEQAPMSGWGQVIGRLFDQRKARVINYAMGGRSFKNAYAEGRLNDILMTGKMGDYIFIQFGHNDERVDEQHRFGRGSSEEQYITFMKDLYVPAIEARGMIPIFVTPMSRLDASVSEDGAYINSFQKKRFPDIMKKVGEDLRIPVIDLNARSVEYYNEIGVEATVALYMSVEAGESPGKTNDGTYANGHPSNKIDESHFKEALAHQFARMIVTEIVKVSEAGDEVLGNIVPLLKEEVMTAIEKNNWDRIFPQMSKDTLSGPLAYYRNQIEKMLQLGVMNQDEFGNFHPSESMKTTDFVAALCKLLNIDHLKFVAYDEEELTRELMGAILYDAYEIAFTEKPQYMIDDYEKSNSNDDPNLDFGRETSYYPIILYPSLIDVDQVSATLASKVQKAYEFGLIRTEKGIRRGEMCNGIELEPKKVVTREKAAKALYFMWVLKNPMNLENDLSSC
ncbi:GDSL-type esterase/lipase family protein [Evansella sp. AB-P1]|uniref:GDSL-type esterase/lipase family protein n=1 Tax=Evansella sp. AB-P1 TaxID=3037653 RepID=UPI0024200117|nr:GDSL-type esterase/lipase family protein [Evansella sp. AB-P1]MDG5788541.1 GDSL-type esterase/lipase family protein [Evansella sp. AB-P1]